MNSRGRASSVRRRGVAPAAVATQMRANDENATCPSAATVSPCARRARTGPVSTARGKSRRSATWRRTGASKGTGVTSSVVRSSRRMPPRSSRNTARPSGAKA